jgi:hypothetical protein
MLIHEFYLNIRLIRTWTMTIMTIERLNGLRSVAIQCTFRIVPVKSHRQISKKSHIHLQYSVSHLAVTHDLLRNKTFVASSSFTLLHLKCIGVFLTIFHLLNHRNLLLTTSVLVFRYKYSIFVKVALRAYLNSTTPAFVAFHMYVQLSSEMA